MHFIILFRSLNFGPSYNKLLDYYTFFNNYTHQCSQIAYTLRRISMAQLFTDYKKKLLFNLCGNALRVTAYVSLFTIITKLNWSFKF